MDGNKTLVLNHLVYLLEGTFECLVTLLLSLQGLVEVGAGI